MERNSTRLKLHCGCVSERLKWFLIGFPQFMMNCFLFYALQIQKPQRVLGFQASPVSGLALEFPPTPYVRGLDLRRTHPPPQVQKVDLKIVFLPYKH